MKKQLARLSITLEVCLNRLSFRLMAFGFSHLVDWSVLDKKERNDSTRAFIARRIDALKQEPASPESRAGRPQYEISFIHNSRTRGFHSDLFSITQVWSMDGEVVMAQRILGLPAPNWLHRLVFGRVRSSCIVTFNLSNTTIGKKLNNLLSPVECRLLRLSGRLATLRHLYLDRPVCEWHGVWNEGDAQYGFCRQCCEEGIYPEEVGEALQDTTNNLLTKEWDPLHDRRLP